MLGGVRRVVRAWRAGVAEQKAHPRARRRRDEAVFLPAAVEVLETPTAPAGHAGAVLVFALLAFALAWGFWGRIDMVATAQGRVVPGGQVKVVQASESGVVQAIAVEEGRRVAAGELLIELDPLAAEVDVASLMKEREIARQAVVRLTAYLEFLAGARVADAEAYLADAKLSEAGLRLLRSEMRTHTASLSALDGERKLLQAEQAALQADLDGLNQLVPLVRQRERALFSLLQSKTVSRDDYNTANMELIQYTRQRQSASRRISEKSVAIANIDRQKAALTADANTAARAQLQEAADREELLTLNLQKAEQRKTRNRLVAPVAGVVQQLQVHTVGAVVQAAQPLMIIVPDDTPLIVEAKLLNKDVGFVHAGQDVQVKLESFPFTKYGLIDGEVARISADAVADEALGLVYDMRVDLSQEHIMVAGRRTDLTPGMAVTAEVKIGDRRAIDFFLSPIKKTAKEALRER